MLNVEFFNHDDRIAVISNDAGATNLIASWAKYFNGTIQPCMSGPAQKIWNENFSEYPLLELDKSLANANVIITGTGWGSKNEKAARKFAKKNKIYSISVVDHWTNHSIRFDEGNDLDLPNEIWVIDLNAKKNVEAIYPRIKVVCNPNIYLIESAEKIKTLSRNFKVQKKKKLLYLLEPIHKNWPGSDIPEIQALDFFLEKYQLIVPRENAEINLRLHPSENINKYQHWLKLVEKKHDLKVSAEENLITQISWADYVFGCETYAMEVAAFAKKPTYSTIPPWGHRCSLQNKNIIFVSNL